MIEIILALCIGFVSGYMVCSTIRNIDKKDKKILSWFLWLEDSAKVFFDLQETSLNFPVN